MNKDKTNQIEHKAVNLNQMIDTLSATKETKLTKNAGTEITAQMRKESLQATILAQMTFLEEAYNRGKVNLNSIDEVKAQSQTYMLACVEAGQYPQMLTYAPFMGYSRRYLYRWLKDNQNTETARYINVLMSAWAGILAQQSLSKMSDNITTIFLLKNSGQNLTNDPIEENTSIKPYSTDRSAETILKEFETITE